MRRYGSNELLRVLITQARWTYAQFAQAVVAVAAETGAGVRCDRTTVSHWLAGTTPRPRTRAFVAEAFSRRLGERVSPADLGWEDALPALTDSQSDDPVTDVVALIDLVCDPARRNDVMLWPFQTDAPIPDRTVCIDTTPPGRIKDVQAGLTFFAHAAAARGSGFTLRTLLAHLTGDLGPRLAAATGDRRAQLAAQTVPFICLTGQSCFDANMTGLAQRFYLQAARLAAAYGDCRGFALAHRFHAELANDLGQHRFALDLAAAVKLETPAAVQAGLIGEAAIALAALGDPAAATERLHEARRLWDECSHTAEPWEGCSEATLAEQRATVHTATRELDSAVAELRTALQLRPAFELRHRILVKTRLAQLHLALGHVTRAADIWFEAAQQTSHVQSARVTQSLQDSARAIQALHRRHPAARGVAEQLAQVSHALAAPLLPRTR